MAGPRYQDLPFGVVSVPTGDGQRRTVARFICTACAAKEEINIPGKLNPEAIVKWAQARGWDVRLRGKRVGCPRCLARRKVEARGESPHAPLEGPPVTQAPLPPPTQAPPPPPAQAPLPPPAPVPSMPVPPPPPPPSAPPILLHPRPTPPPAPPAPPAAVPPERPLGVRDRIRLRGLLEQHFDAERGYYRPGWTDARLAAEAGVASAQVAAVREAAYGPIVSTAEREAVRDELPRLRQQLADALAELRREHESRCAELRQLFQGKIDALEAQLAAPAEAA